MGTAHTKGQIGRVNAAFRRRLHFGCGGRSCATEDEKSGKDAKLHDNLPIVNLTNISVFAAPSRRIKFIDV
jgi:hypothetical protein